MTAQHGRRHFGDSADNAELVWVCECVCEREAHMMRGECRDEIRGKNGKNNSVSLGGVSMKDELHTAGRT